MAVKRHGWPTKIGIAVLVFIGLWSAIELPAQTLAVVAIVAALVIVWALDITTAVLSYYRGGGPNHRREERPISDVIQSIANRRTPSVSSLSSTVVVVLATVVVISVAFGTGIGAFDEATPSVGVGSVIGTVAETADGPDRPPNEAMVGGSFGTITLDNASNEIVLNVESTDDVDGVIIVAPDRNQVASSDISVGTRQLMLRSSQAHRNGTYEIIGVQRDEPTEDVPLAQLEEAESHEVQLNISQ